MKLKFLNRFLILVLALSFSPIAFAQEGEPPVCRSGRPELPAVIAEKMLSVALEISGIDLDTLDRSLFAAAGSEKVIIRLKTPSVAKQKVRSKSAQRAKKQIKAEQEDLLSRVLRLDPNARVVAQVQLVLNAVFVEVDASVLPKLMQDPAVLSIKRKFL